MSGRKSFYSGVPCTSVMVDSIPVPAEALRQVAQGAAESIDTDRTNGYKATARNKERALSQAYTALNGHDGEYVSVQSHVVSRLTAGARASDSINQEYVDCCRHYLEQYGVWS